MDEEELNIPQEDINSLSVINNPFQTKNVTNILISYSKNVFSDKQYWYGRVTFKDGSTTGEHRTPDVQTFQEIVDQIKLILNSTNK